MQKKKKKEEEEENTKGSVCYFGKGWFLFIYLFLKHRGGG